MPDQQWDSTDNHAAPAGGGWDSTENHGADAPEPKSVGGFIQNVFNSGGRMVRDVVGAATHPAATLSGVTGLLEGMAEKSGFKPVAGVSHEQNVDALVNLYKQRYGSMDNFAKTLYEDPVGVMADVATLAGAGGLAAKGVQAGAKAAGLARTADVAGTVAKAAGTVADFTDPMALASKGAGAAARAVLPTPEKLYLSALKAPPSWYTPAEADTLAKTGIGEKVLVSEGGLQKLQGLIDNVNDKIKDTIKTGAASGVTVDPQAIAARADQIKGRFAHQVNATPDLDAIDASKDLFLKENPGPIPVDKAQAMKQGTYAQLKDKAYGELKSANIEAQKSLARGIKEELATAFPELSGLNAKDSRLLNLEDALERSVRRIGNHQLFGIGTPIAAAGAGAATGSAKAAAVVGALRAAVDNPQVKSALAIALNYGKNPTTGVSMRPATVASRIQEYVDALGQYNGPDATAVAPAGAGH